MARDAGMTTFDRVNPVTGAVASTTPAMTPAEAVAVADAAAAALPAWSALGPNARRAALNAAAVALEGKGEALVAAMVAECGAHDGWARFNLGLAAGMLREAGALTTQIGGEVIPSDKPGCLALALREPAGVVLGIAPWNAPLILAVRAIAVPLACGNTVVLKASEVCPRTHGLIVEAFADAGFEPGIVGLVSNALADAGDVVGALIDHPAVRRINFTGSTAVGRIIAVRAAENLKPCLLELGGKAPLLVLADADLSEAVKAAAFGAFMNAGQICMSTERIIVVDSVADAFVAAFAAKVATMHPAAVVDRKTVTHVAALVDAAVAAGATLVGGGPADGVVMTPHVVDHVTPAMALFRDESFGPVVGITRARDEDHAVELANDSAYGLSASVFTRDVARALAVAKRIKSGICHINGPTVHDEAQMPFGGTKASGYGRFGGRAGIDAFTELRWVTIETQPGQLPI